MSTSEHIALQFANTFSADGSGDQYSADHFSGLTLGVVVDTDDPLETGRLRIFCPSLNDNPKKVQHLPWASYVTPFAGSISNSNYFRGTDPENATSDGSLHYGFWSIPEMGAHVLVGCIDGDPRRRFWIGCIPEHQQANTIHHGRYKWDDGNVEGPLTGSSSPLQPLYDNMRTAFDGKTDSPEFRSRVAEYQTSAVSEDVGQIPNSKMRDSLDQQNSQIIDNNPDSWEHATLGAHGYDWSGFKELGGFMSSRVFGWSTPGMHAFTMDDRPFNSRMKLRTTAGHQILMDDTNERIYITTYNGKNYIEMDVNGNIDCYSANRISFHAEKDINFTTQGTYRVFARDGIHMFAGDTNSGVNYDNEDSYDMPEVATPYPGEIRIQSTMGITHLSQGDIRSHSLGDTYTESSGNFYSKIDKSYFNEVKDNINIVTDSGSYNADIAAELNENIGQDSKRFSGGNSSVASNGTNEIQSFQGATDIGARDGVNVKTATGSVNMESNGYDGAGGAVKIKTPGNEIDVGNDGVKIASATAITIAAAAGINMLIDALLKNKIKSPFNLDAIPDDIGNTPAPDSGAGTPLPWDDNYDGGGGSTPSENTCRQSITIDEAVLVAYNAGFRGKDLVIAVAVALAESNLMTLSHKKVEGEIFSETVGLYNIKTFSNPEDCGDAFYRNNTDRKLENPNENALAAHAIFMDEAPFGEWTGGKWSSVEDGRAEEYMPAAIAAVERFSENNINLSNEIRQAIRDLEIATGYLTGLMNAMVNKSDSIMRTIAKANALQGVANGLIDAFTIGDPVGALMGEINNEIARMGDQLSFMISNAIQQAIPADVLTAMADVQELMNSVSSLLSTISSLAGMLGKTALNMDGMVIDMDAPMDINMRTLLSQTSEMTLDMLFKQFNISALLLNQVVSAIEGLGGSISLPIPVPILPFPPTLSPLQIKIPEIPKLKIPAFTNPIVKDILKNNSSDSVKKALADREKEWRESIKEQFDNSVNNYISIIDSDTPDATDGGFI